MERHLKEENENYELTNVKLVKENEKISEEMEKMKNKNNLLYTQAFKWLQEKNSWKAKYEKQKVKTSIYKEDQGKEMDSIFHIAQHEVTGSRIASASSLRRSKRKQQP